MMGRRLQIQYRMMLADLGVPPWVITWLVTRIKTDKPPDRQKLEDLTDRMVNSLVSKGHFRLAATETWTGHQSILPMSMVPHHAARQWRQLLTVRSDP
jgi:hypothetical protein